VDLVLGLVSLVIPVPRNERDSLRAGGIFLGVETRHGKALSRDEGADDPGRSQHDDRRKSKKLTIL